MEQAPQQIDKIIKSKLEHRKKLASLPFEEKYRLLLEMQERRRKLLANVKK